jgi:hypothetical protein
MGIHAVIVDNIDGLGLTRNIEKLGANLFKIRHHGFPSVPEGTELPVVTNIEAKEMIANAKFCDCKWCQGGII